MGNDVTILFAGYRSWALAAYPAVMAVPGIRLPHVSTPEHAAQVFAEARVRAAFFCGWSWYVPPLIVANIPCYCLHPSPLPKYRGGSPLQHQIIAGETDSMATVFRMTQEMDAGPIVAERHLSLEGSLADIYERLAYSAATMFEGLARAIVAGTSIRAWPQEGTPTAYKRRKPAESEITDGERANASPEFLANKIRALAHPDYPNAFIRCADGSKLYLREAGPSCS